MVVDPNWGSLFFSRTYLLFVLLLRQKRLAEKSDEVVKESVSLFSQIFLFVTKESHDFVNFFFNIE